MEKINFNIFTLIYLFTLPFLFIDTYKSRTTTLTYINISSRQIEVWVIFALILCRIFTKQTLDPVLTKINNYVILPLTLVLGIALTIWDYFSTPNYVFSLTRLQYTQLFYIGMFSTIVWLLSHTDAWFAKQYSRIIFFGSTAYLAAAVVVSLFPRDVFAKFSKEDHLVENLQFIILVLGALWSFQVAKRFYKLGSKINAALFLLATMTFIFIAGDEISWGQRVLHIATPRPYAEINDQQEITLHNLSFFSQYVSLSYMLIGLYGAIAWLVQIIIPRLQKVPFTYYIPAWFCSLFYFSGFLYNYIATYFNFPVGLWAESAELMLYSGLSFTTLSVLISGALTEQKTL